MSEIILKAENLSKNFGAFKALDNLNIEIPKGGIFGLLGPNGAGKTTFIRLINQIIYPDNGVIYIDGEKLDKNHIKDIGYMPEERGLYKNLSVAEQALYLARLKGLSETDAKQKLDYWLEKLQISSWKNKKIQELSKGMAQKIQFIVNIMHEPKFLILDEPFSGFDPLNADLIEKEIKELQKNGTTILFSTHRMESVEQMCSHILLLNKGKAVLSGEISKIKSDFSQNIFKISISGADKQNIEKLPEFISWTKTGKAKVKLPLGETSNKFLEKIMQMGQVNSFSELSPKMSDIFIEVVTNSHA